MLILRTVEVQVTKFLGGRQVTGIAWVLKFFPEIFYQFLNYFFILIFT